MAISKTCSNARKIIRKLDDAGWNLVAFDVLDGEGMEPVKEWKVSKEKNTKSLAVIGADIVDAVDYSMLFFNNRKYDWKMHLTCVPLEATGEESVVNDIVAPSELIIKMIERAIA
tara:strand:+ start:1526 stop:1870 length:345 start_codon:yes stop_codon:yes gene_type:complete